MPGIRKYVADSVGTGTADSNNSNTLNACIVLCSLDLDFCLFPPFSFHRRLNSKCFTLRSCIFEN